MQTKKLEFIEIPLNPDSRVITEEEKELDQYVT